MDASRGVYLPLPISLTHTQQVLFDNFQINADNQAQLILYSGILFKSLYFLFLFLSFSFSPFYSLLFSLFLLLSLSLPVLLVLFHRAEFDHSNEES